MKYSILLPARLRNTWDRMWFDEAIYSIRAQAHARKVQIVIVWDESDYKEDFYYATHVVIEKSSGLANALNEGIKHCTGDIIIRMDADDIAKYGFIEEVIHFWESNTDEKAAACGIQLEAFHYMDNRPMDLGGGFPTKHPAVINHKAALDLARQGHFWWVNHPGVSFRKDVVQSLGGYREADLNGQPVGGMEDMILWLRLVQAGCTVHNLPKVLMRYRWKPHSRHGEPYNSAHTAECVKFLTGTI